MCVNRGLVAKLHVSSSEMCVLGVQYMGHSTGKPAQDMPQQLLGE